MSAPFLPVRIETLSPRSWWEVWFYGCDKAPPVVVRRKAGDAIGRNVAYATPEQIRAANERLMQTTRREVI